MEGRLKLTQARAVIRPIRAVMQGARAAEAARSYVMDRSADSGGAGGQPYHCGPGRLPARSRPIGADP